MLRAPDLNTIFSRYFRVRQTVFMENCSYDSIREAHGWWKKRYSAEELGVEIVGIEAIPE